MGRFADCAARELRERAKELLQLVGLENAADRRIGGYSKGMLQRIGLAQALVQEPRLLVLDEPTAGVDPAGRARFAISFSISKAAASPCCSARICSARCRRFATASAFCTKAHWSAKAGSTDLISIENQTELILENASPELLAAIEQQSAAGGARVVEKRKPQTTLERFFLEVTQPGGGKE